MNRFLHTIALLLLNFHWIQAQNYYTTMDVNNAEYRVSNSGVFFNDPMFARGVYYVPKSLNTSLIYATAFWFGAVDENGQIKLAGMRYGESGSDFKPGPYSTSDYGNAYGNAIWQVTSAEIETHMQSWNTPGYVIPSGILNWPGNGDTDFGVAEKLAPFRDLNQNDIYEPQLGEYPLIKGCEAIYMILNDYTLHTETQGEPIHIEVHYMFYQYLSDSALNNTTFMDVTVYNRTNTMWQDFKISLFADNDIGNSTDDYVGCDTTKNVFYAYNADNIDEPNSGIPGFGTNPPAAGFLSLNQKASSFIAYKDISSSSYPHILPSFASGMWMNMNGYWSDGSNILDNNGNPTRFMYHESPLVSNSYSETGIGNPPRDVRTLTTFDAILLPGGKKELSFAILYNRSGNSLQNAADLLLVADSIQQWYDAGIEGCTIQPLGVEELQSLSTFTAFPNPAADNVTIRFEQPVTGNLTISSVNGNVVSKFPVNAQEITIPTNKLSEGVYFIGLESARSSYNKTKLVIVHK